MSNSDRVPESFDAVLSHNHAFVPTSVVLGGMTGVKQAFALAESDADKINALKQALNYGDAGADWLFDLVATECDLIQWIAAALISATQNEEYKQILVSYFAWSICDSIDRWNSYKQHIPEIQLYLQGINLQSVNLQKIDFVGANLSNADLRNSDCQYAKFAKSDLSYAKLDRAFLAYAEWNEVNLKNADVESAQIVDLVIESSNFDGTNFKNAYFCGCEIRRTNFKNTVCEGASFNQFSNTFENIIFFSSTNMKEASFGDSYFKRVVFLNCESEGIYLSGNSFDRAIFRKGNFSNADFTYIQCRNTIFNKTNLENAKFMFSDFSRVRFDRVNLRGADFRWSNLSGIDFTGLDVSGANFTRCDLADNNLDKANTKGAKFSTHPSDTKLYGLREALFDDRHYYESGYE